MKISRRSLKRAAIVVVTLLAVAGSVVWALRFVQSPAEGVVIKPPLEDKGAETLGIKTATLNGDNFALDYGSEFTDVANVSKQSPGSIEQYRMNNNQIAGNSSIVVSIKKLPPGGIPEDASYHMRVLRPAEYTESTITFDGAGVPKMKRDDGSEITVFIVHKQQLATIAVTSNDPTVDIDQLMKRAVDGFRWKN